MNIFLNKHKKTVILIFLVSMGALFLLLFLLSLVKPLYIDEGVFLSIGKGIAQGKKMYLDFWDHKTPGIHLLYAFLFSFFSTKIIFYKLFLWLVNIFTAGLVYFISEKERKGSGKFASIIFLTTLVFLEGNYLSAGPYLAFFLTLAAYFILAVPAKTRYVFLGGASLAMAFIFKQTALLNLFVFLFFFLFTKRFKDLLYFFAGLLVPIGLMLAYLARLNVLSEFKSEVFGATSYPSETISFRLSKWFETFSRVWWLWLVFIVGIFGKMRMKKEKVFLLFMIIVPFIAFMRHYPHYWLQVLPFMAIFAGIGFSALIEKYYQRVPYVFVGLFIIILFSLFQSMLWYNWVTNHLNAPKQKEESDITKELKRLDYDKILAENRYTGFYFLSDKEPLSRFLFRTEVNEKIGSVTETFDNLKAEHKVVALWPKDQTLVYSKEIGTWLEKNTRKVNYYPELDLVIYYKD